MRVPKVGWAFFGLAVVIYAVYLLNRGIFIGSIVVPAQGSFPDGRTLQFKECEYLHLTGISLVQAGSDFDRNVAEGFFCPPLKNSN
jgi:hypothetical protein